MYFARDIEHQLKEALKQFPACLITGSRQSGKSTLLQHSLPSYRYVTLDNPIMRALAVEDPELFLSSYPSPLIIDEIQYAPNLLFYLKMRIDQNRQLRGQFVLTGSQTFQVMKGVSESLAGRIAIFQLYPFCWNEIGAMPGKPPNPLNDLEMGRQVVGGFYPEFFSQPNIDHNLWYSSFLNTYIERDVRNIKSITDLGRFQTFIRLLATRAGQLLNMAELAKECGISQPTVKDWLSILSSTYIIHILQPYHKNHTKRLVKSPKIFFVDTGLLCFLLGVDSAERFFKVSEKGHIFENMVVMEYVKRLSLQSGLSSCYFYRTASGVEVDLLVEAKGKLFAYEIKLAKTLSREMAQPLVLFCKEHQVEGAALLSLQEQTIPLAENITARHWSLFSTEEI